MLEKTKTVTISKHFLGVFDQPEKILCREKAVSVFFGKIAVCNTDVSTPPGALVLVLAESGWLPFIGKTFEREGKITRTCFGHVS